MWSLNSETERDFGRKKEATLHYKNDPICNLKCVSSWHKSVISLYSNPNKCKTPSVKWQAVVTEHTQIFSLLHSFPPLHLPLLHPQHITEWNAACNYPLSNQLELTLNHLCRFGLSQLSVRALSGLSTAEPHCIIVRPGQTRSTAGGEPGCCLKVCCCCWRLAGRMRSGHWQQRPLGAAPWGPWPLECIMQTSHLEGIQIVLFKTLSDNLLHHIFIAPTSLSPTDPVTHDWTHSPHRSSDQIPFYKSQAWPRSTPPSGPFD